MASKVPLNTPFFALNDAFKYIFLQNFSSSDQRIPVKFFLKDDVNSPIKSTISINTKKMKDYMVNIDKDEVFMFERGSYTLEKLLSTLKDTCTRKGVSNVDDYEFHINLNYSGRGDWKSLLDVTYEQSLAYQDSKDKANSKKKKKAAHNGGLSFGRGDLDQYSDDDDEGEDEEDDDDDDGNIQQQQPKQKKKEAPVVTSLGKFDEGGVSTQISRKRRPITSADEESSSSSEEEEEGDNNGTPPHSPRLPERKKKKVTFPIELSSSSPAAAPRSLSPPRFAVKKPSLQPMLPQQPQAIKEPVKVQPTVVEYAENHVFKVHPPTKYQCDSKESLVWLRPVHPMESKTTSVLPLYTVQFFKEPKTVLVRSRDDEDALLTLYTTKRISSTGFALIPHRTDNISLLDESRDVFDLPTLVINEAGLSTLDGIAAQLYVVDLKSFATEALETVKDLMQKLSAKMQQVCELGHGDMVKELFEKEFSAVKCKEGVYLISSSSSSTIKEENKET
jgi:hypothetical protein